MDEEGALPVAKAGSEIALEKMQQRRRVLSGVIRGTVVMLILDILQWKSGQPNPAAKAGTEDSLGIAALEALRYPKSSVSVAVLPLD